MDKITDILESANSILVTSHLQPDPDAICSALGVYDYILKMYPQKKVEIMLGGTLIEEYTSFKNYDKVKWVEDIADLVNNFDTLFFVDGSQLSRFTNKKDQIELSKFKSICIDHHSNKPSNFDVLIIQPEEPSAAQLIYKYLFRGTELIDSYVAEILLTGILSDTGMLKFVHRNEIYTLDYVKELIEICDLDIGEIEQKYFQLTESDWDIIQELTKNIVKVDDVKDPFIYSYLPMAYLNKYPLNVIKKGKSKFLIFFGTTIQKYTWSFVATPNSMEEMNISFRSTPESIDVSVVASEFGLGGGHKQASGGKIEINNGEESEMVAKRIAEKIKTLNL